jgi:hypothetical protein
MINATKFFGQVVGSSQPGGKAKFWVMDAQGVILYEIDSRSYTPKDRCLVVESPQTVSISLKISFSAYDLKGHLDPQCYMINFIWGRILCDRKPQIHLPGSALRPQFICFSLKDRSA